MRIIKKRKEAKAIDAIHLATRLFMNMSGNKAEDDLRRNSAMSMLQEAVRLTSAEFVTSELSAIETMMKLEVLLIHQMEQ